MVKPMHTDSFNQQQALQGEKNSRFMSLFHRLFRREKRPPIIWEPTRPVTPPAYYDREGRRYRGDVPYLLPMDEKEIQRLDYQHFILRHILNGNYFAPVHDLLSQESRVLDVGCGAGRWGHEVATVYPQAEVTGIDLEHIPRVAPAPANYQFYRGNLLNGLPFADKYFHYVHQRLLVAAIPAQKWPWVIGELKRGDTS